MVGGLSTKTVVQSLVSRTARYSRQGRLTFSKRPGNGPRPCWAAAQEQSDLALGDTEWVTLRSGKRVRVDSLGYRPNVAGAWVAACA